MTTSGLPGLPGDCVAVVVAALGRSTVVVCGRRAAGGGVAVVGFGADPTACDGAWITMSTRSAAETIAPTTNVVHSQRPSGTAAP